MVPLAPQTVVLHGHELSYVDSGSGPVVLFIHGILGSQRQWSHLVDQVDDDAVLAELEGEGRIAFRYCDAAGKVTPEANPNGSVANIAGIVNREGNVLGMMPHPERAVDALLGSESGAGLFRSLEEYLGAVANA